MFALPSRNTMPRHLGRKLRQSFCCTMPQVWQWGFYFYFILFLSLNAVLMQLTVLSVSSTIQSGPITFSLSLSLIFPSICDSNSIPWHFPALFQHKWKQWNILIVSPPHPFAVFFMVDRMAFKNIKFYVTGWCNNGLGYLNTLGAHPHLTNEQVEPFLKHGEKMSSSH